MGTSGLVALPRRTRLVSWRRAIGSPGTLVVPCEWSTEPALHCSRTSHRHMMALVSDALETCMHTLETHEPSCTGRPACFSLCLRGAAHREPQDVWQCQSPFDWEAGSGAIGYEAVPEPSLARRWSLEP
jgi:hypothetical protein